MTIAGIIAEYNPFHLGHQYHIQETRRRLGEDCGIVCVMSGDFVQRGEPAIFSKFARAKAAVCCGADLVVELPLPWCMASAERFSQGAVQILGDLGIVDVLSFGSESGDVAAIAAVSKDLDSDLYIMEHLRYIEKVMKFAARRQKAVENTLGPGYGEILCRPNDNLAVEYLRALYSNAYNMKPLAVCRIGAGHDERTAGRIRSGSDLREQIIHDGSVESFLPPEAQSIFQYEMQQGRGPVAEGEIELLLLSRLRMLAKTDFESIPDASEGLEQKLFSACQVHASLSDIYHSVKSKRYTHARIRRMTLSAALGIQKMHFFERPSYARILAFNAAGSQILKEAKQKGRIPILSKPAAVKTLEPSAYKVFELTAKAHDLYVLTYKNAGFRAGGQDWTSSPYRIC